jgi:transcriptional regulator with XRE-family HTH domain
MPSAYGKITRQGRLVLGNLVRSAREKEGLTLVEFIDLVWDLTGERIGSHTTISEIERGNRNPNWNTLAAIAATGIVKKSDGEPYRTHELFYIACEEQQPE